MTKKVISVNENDTAADAAQKMKSADIGSVVVQNNNGLSGIITDRDIVLRNIATGKSADSTCKDIMSSRLITADPEMSVERAAELMSSNQIKRIPVVENGKTVGVVAMADIVQAGVGEEEKDKVVEGITKQRFR